MAQYNLTWSLSAITGNSNITALQAAYRQKSLGGSFLTTGFTPANDLAVTVSAAQSGVLADNKIWEFKISSICTTGGPTLNDNGVQEGFKFACIVPVVSQGETTSGITIDVTGLDITKAQLKVKKNSNSSIAFGPVIAFKSGNSITQTATGLTGGDTYHWEIVLYATVNSIEVNSAMATPLGTGGVCNSSNFTTDIPTCNPLTSIEALASVV